MSADRVYTSDMTTTQKPTKVADRTWQYAGITIKAHKGFGNSKRGSNREYTFTMPVVANEMEINLPEWQGMNIEIIDGVAFTNRRYSSLTLDAAVRKISDLINFNNK